MHGDCHKLSNDTPDVLLCQALHFPYGSYHDGNFDIHGNPLPHSNQTFCLKLFYLWAMAFWNLSRFLVITRYTTCIQFHLIGIQLIRISGSHQDFSPDKLLLWRTIVASLSVITMAYQVRNLDHFLKFRLTRFWLSEITCIIFKYMQHGKLYYTIIHGNM